MGTAEMEIIGGAIARVLEAPADTAVLEEVRQTVRELCAGFPLYVFA
jgi:glycine/serine hydroxymethyltransferase